MLQSIYDQMMDFYRNIEEEYGIGCRRDFIVYHYRVAYRLYLEKLIMKQGFVAC